MKRTLFNKTLKPACLVIPAAALMLGVSQAQNTVGINFVAQYATYATVGTGYGGYQTTGFNVTAPAFGVPVANWVNAGPMPGFYNYATGTNFNMTAGSIVANFSYSDMWASDLGDLNPWPYYSGSGSNPNSYWGTLATVNPGNDQVTWGIEDSGGWTNTLSGLAATFPHGYVLELISAGGRTGTNKITSASQAIVTDGATFTNTLAFNVYAAGNTNAYGYVGLASSATLTNDAITMQMSTNKCSLAGFILTDQPIISQPTLNITKYNQQTLILSSGAVGIAPISYQWLFNGAPLSGATTAIYTNAAVTYGNAGNYSVIVSNPYGTSSNLVASVSVIPLTLQMVPGNIIQDTKPQGTPNDGYNHNTTWLAAGTDLNSITRSGVEQFSVTNSGQITIPPVSNLNPTNGTICFWINYNAPLAGLPGSGSEAAMLYDNRALASAGGNGTIIAANASGGIEFQAQYGARFTGGIDVIDGNWHQVTVTYGQTTNDMVSIYVDGTLDTALANPGNWSWPTNLPIELGQSRDIYWKIYDGQMDDFRIYNRMLTTDEITTIATPATSDSLIDTNALVLQYNFNNDSATFGTSLVWPYGSLITSPTLGAGAVWTPISGAMSPYPFVTAGSTAPAMFYRLSGAK